MSLHSESATAPENSSFDTTYEENIDSIDLKKENNEQQRKESMSLHSEYATVPGNSSIDITYEENIDSIDLENRNNGQLRKDIDMNIVDLKYEMKDKAIDIDDQKSASTIEGKSFSNKNASFQIENEKKKMSMK